MQAINATDTSVSLQWQNNNALATTILIERSTNATSGFTVVDSVTEIVTTKNILGIYNEYTTYYFRLQAKSSLNVSPYSNVDSIQYIPSPEMVLASGGTFKMGSKSGNPDEQPTHDVTLSNFYIGKYEITQAQWRTVVQWKQGNKTSPLNPDPSYLKGDKLPVERVSWDDIQWWISYLNEEEGTNKFRLPTEAEWEFAARGGNNTKGYTFSGSDTVGNVAWYVGNCANATGGTSHTVGTKAANELGIYDMSGNVMEWCSDWYGLYDSTAQTNPIGLTSGASEKVLRGGNYDSDDSSCHVTSRGRNYTGAESEYVGFRVARTP